MEKYTPLDELDDYQNLMKELTDAFNIKKKLHKQQQKSIKQKIMIMRAYRKKKREEFSKAVRNEFLNLFTAYILF